MFTITEAAQEKILARMEAEGKADRTLRIRIVGWTADDYQYRLEVIPADARDEGDVEVSNGRLPLLLAGDSAEKLKGATLDFVESAQQHGFSIDNPNPVWTDPLELKIQRILDQKINPGVGMHGGQVRLLKAEDGVAYISFGGGCVGCGMSNVTLKQGVDRMIREEVPEITQIVDTTDHASGTNPYYQPSETAEAESPLA
ncbi:MAG TPA: NifU family protein [Anaerolineales bacterium]|jgi:Fe/S biogenesis protein NfuA